MSKLTISDLHFSDISLDASGEVRGGVSDLFELGKNYVDSRINDFFGDTNLIAGPVINGENFTTSQLIGVSISETGSAA